MKKWDIVVKNPELGVNKVLEREYIYADNKESATEKVSSRIGTICHGKYAKPGWTFEVVSSDDI